MSAKAAGDADDDVSRRQRSAMHVLSIVTVTKDDAVGLSKTLRSLASQDCSPDLYQVLIQDGGSVGLSFEEVQALPHNYHYACQQDRGIYDGMNLALKRATAEYVMFLNSGDCLDRSDALDRIIRALHAADGPRPVWAITGGTDLGGALEEPRYLPAQFSWVSFVWNRQALLHQACVYRRDVLLAAAGYDLTIPIVADYDLALRMGLLSQPLLIDLPLVAYEGGGISDLRSREIPRLKAQVRRSRLALQGPLLLADMAYTRLQELRRRLS